MARMVVMAAFVFSVLTLVVVLFQFALALGAPWGAYAMGGYHPGVYPPKLRVAAVGQGLLLTFLALIVLVKAGLVLPEQHELAVKTIWVVVGLMAVTTILNIITTSKWERRFWGPVSTTLLLTSLLVALGQ